jgi:hypothetical protein
LSVFPLALIAIALETLDGMRTRTRTLATTGSTDILLEL